jgi:hypothetical protein
MIRCLAIFIALILPATSFSGELSVDLSSILNGSTAANAIKIKAKDKVEHLSFLAEYSFCRSMGVVCGDKGSLLIKSSHEINEKLSMGFYDKASFDNIRDIKENELGVGPSYKLTSIWTLSTYLVHNAKVGTESVGLGSYRVKAVHGEYSLKYTYQHNIIPKESGDYRNEFKVIVPWKGVRLYHSRSKRYGYDRELEGGVELYVDW